MKHKHVLKTLDTEYQVITDSPDWCWHDFFDEVMPDCKVFKIRLIMFKEKGKTLLKEYK